MSRRQTRPLHGKVIPAQDEQGGKHMAVEQLRRPRQTFVWPGSIVPARSTGDGVHDTSLRVTSSSRSAPRRLRFAEMGHRRRPRSSQTVTFSLLTPTLCVEGWRQAKEHWGSRTVRSGQGRTLQEGPSVRRGLAVSLGPLSPRSHKRPRERSRAAHCRRDHRARGHYTIGKEQ